MRSPWPNINERRSSTSQPGSHSVIPQVEVYGRRMSGSMANKPAFSPASSARPTPVSSPAPQFADSEKERTVKPMSKEEKAAEMARRKEERRLVCTCSDIPSTSTLMTLLI